jgi:N-acetylneuraminic acid mutarotase
LNDFYLWESSSLRWKNLSVITPNTPSPRAGHGLTSVDSRLFVFGGDNGSSVLNDLYEYNISSKKWCYLRINDTQPTPRAGHGFVSTLGKLYVFGGRNDIGGLFSVIAAMQVKRNQLTIGTLCPQAHCRMICGS